MGALPRFLIALFTAGLVALARAASADDDERWRPPDLLPATGSLNGLLAHLPATDPGSDGRIEHAHLHTYGADATATIAVRGRDYRVRIELDGRTFELGTSGDVPWRAESSGLVRTVKSDVQSDALDRWPRAIYGFDPADCTLEGQTAGPHPLTVVRDQPKDVAPHWFFIDPATGELAREVLRDGIRVVTFTFSDVRDSPHGRRPFAWRIEGGGPASNVIVEDVAAATLTGGDVVRPASSRAEYFTLPGDAPVVLPTRFQDHQITVEVSVNGRREHFILDGGTTSMTMSADGAHRAGLSWHFDHTVASAIDVNGIAMHDVPILVVPFIGTAIDGLLGYDFFVGHIVHIDYRRRIVDVRPSRGFTPPPDAARIPIDVTEGLPLARARIGTIDGDRFALDTGSPEVLIADAFFRDRGLAALGFKRWLGTLVSYGFLEGPLTERPAALGDITFANMRIAGDNEVLIEQPRSRNLVLPLDGILGTNLLSKFELWFDYPDGALSLRPN